MSEDLVARTCPEIDKAFDECIRIVKERGTELLREALIDCCDEKYAMERKIEDLEESIAALEKKVAYLEDENGQLLKDLDAASSRGT